MSTLRKSLGSLFIVSLMLTSTIVSSGNIQAQTPATSAPRAKQQILTKDELYFGMSKPGGGMFSEAQWEQFLNSEITPRFRDGLTVLEGYGQYLNSRGILAKEKTKLVILIYVPSPEKNQAINEIIDSYKQKFQQESVLRVSSTVQVSL